MMNVDENTSTPDKASLQQNERKLLKKIGLRIQNDLHRREKTAEWLATRVGIARSTLREIIAGRSNPRVLTLQAIAIGLDYKDAQDFLQRVLSDEE